MSRWVAALALVICAGGCGDPTASAPASVVLRVGAAHGLSKFVPNPRLSGSTAYAMELVYEPLNGNAEVVRREGRNVFLRRLPQSEYSVDTLAASLRFAGLVRSYLDRQQIVAVFKDERSARGLGDPQVGEVGAFALGPYALEEQRPGRVRLRGRAPRPIDFIELREVTGGQQWRQLLGHKLDVLPNLSGIQRGRFRGMKTVRVIEFQHTSELVLLFNTRLPALRPDVRTRLASLIDVDAVGRVACGATGCEPSWRHHHASSPKAVELPNRLHLAVLKVHAPSTLAARVIALELGHSGVHVTPVEVSLARFGRVVKGDFELAIMPVPFGRAGLARFTTQRIGSFNVPGYSNPDYDAAVAAGELAKARTILANDVPALPLFPTREFAAIDARFCGKVDTRTASSWRWIADLHPCKPGEQP